MGKRDEPNVPAPFGIERPEGLIDDGSQSPDAIRLNANPFIDEGVRRSPPLQGLGSAVELLRMGRSFKEVTHRNYRDRRQCSSGVGFKDRIFKGLVLTTGRIMPRFR